MKAIDTPHSTTDFTIAYEGNGPLVNYIDYPNGQRVDYAWKSKTSGRFLDSITNNKTSSGTQISKFDYPTHSGSGQIKSWTKTQKDNLGATVTTPWTITYDNLYRVDQVNNTSGDDYDFDYDSSDNRTRRKINGSGIQYQVNARNQLTQPSSGVEYKFSYDANGNITERRNSSTNALLIEYEWDAINRLKAVEIPGTSRSEFFYDGQHRCYKKIEKNGSGTVLSTEYYVWCGTERCQKRVGSSNPADIKSNYYSHGETRHTSTSNSTPYYYTFDHLGSLREVTNSSGVVQVAYDYTPYGERSEVVGASESWSLDAEWGFTGHYHHEQTGLHLALYRAYDAEMGRWLNADPIGEVGGLNLYAYVGGDPINAWDPFGLEVDGTYSISKKTLTLRDRDTGESVSVPGCSSGTNNADDASTGFRGPTPPGKYQIYKAPRKIMGQDSYVLDPIDRSRGNDKYDGEFNDRYGFRIHLEDPGDKAGLKGSRGCVVMSQASLDKVKKLLENTKPGRKRRIKSPDEKNPGKYEKFGRLPSLGTLTVTK